MAAAVEKEHDGRSASEVAERVEERLAEHARGGGAAAVQEHERPVGMPPRQDSDLVEVLVDEAAVPREMDEPCPACRVVARASSAACGCPDDDG